MKRRAQNAMTSLEDFKEILAERNVIVPDHLIELLRDLVDIQAEMVLDSYIKEIKN